MRGLFNFLKKILWLAFLGGLTGFFMIVGVLTVVSWQVFYGDVSELKKNAILAKIREETTLYYLDEKTTIGSIFESGHRRYVPIEEMPAHLLSAVVASEDKNFYHHVGIDPLAIGKAIAEGIQDRGHFKRGGSTLTQQTVKNIANDWEMSFARKFREMIKSFQMERLYSKKQILEFYLNQFHVAGNGNGIGIAARYYFNKDVKDINLIEAAFIAGSVKGPSKYNPFIKYTKAAKDNAIKYAGERKNYVLERMFEQGLITKKEYEEGTKMPIPFNRGEFRTAEVALVDLVREQLQKKEILQALGLTDSEDLNTAGLRVYTTLDAEFQTAAQLAMRRNLSRLETILQGFAPEPKEEFRLLRDLEKDSFIFGKVEAIEGKDFKDYQVKLSFGLPSGVIPNESLVRYAKLLDLVDGKGYQVHMKNMMDQIKVGDILFVQVLDYKKETHEAKVELQKRPKISGGLVALDKGEVRTVISGFDTLGYNRAISAKRQPGSVFKTITFFSALQLGWSILDRLENVRQLFPYQGRFYYPRADHDSPYENVSMLWAGVMSENLASVTLGARLVDKLNFDQFKKLMGSMNLLPSDGEVPRDYHYRVARKLGVSLDNEGVMAYQLVNAINEAIPDVIFTGDQKILGKLRQMWWGHGYLAEINHLHSTGKSSSMRNELGVRHSLVLNNYLRLEKLASSLAQDWDRIKAAIKAQGIEKSFADPSLQSVFEKFHVITSPGAGRPELGYFSLVEGEEKIATRSLIPLSEPSGRALNQLDVHAIWGEGDISTQTLNAGITVADVKLSGYLPAKIFDRIKEFTLKHYESVMSSTDPYQLHAYFQHYDFRIALGLNYVVNLSKACGVYNHLEPVLSFPLGTSDVTTSEVAKVFQTFISGKAYRFYESGPGNQINFIRRIEDRFGHVLFKPEPKEQQVVVPVIAHQMREILRKVVTHGTGRRAKGELYVAMDEELKSDDKNAVKIRVPSFGKTGTTNDFTTAYFAGFMPYPTEENSKLLDPENSYVVASYVGYDRNKIMRRGRQRIYGGTGALPMWTDFLKEVIRLKKYNEKIDMFDLDIISRREWPIKFYNQSAPFVTDLPRGVVLRRGSGDEPEAWNPTKLAFTGEEYQNEFALDNSVASTVYFPTNRKSGNAQASRYFSLFNTNESESVEEFPLQRLYPDEPATPNSGTAGATPPEVIPGNDHSSLDDSAETMPAEDAPLENEKKEAHAPMIPSDRSKVQR